MVNTYRRNIPNAAAVQAPLHVYMVGAKKNDKREIDWSKVMEEAFEKLKSDIANATLLSHPSPEADSRVVSDASDFKMGAALEQYLDNSWKALAFFRESLTQHKLNIVHMTLN